MKTAQTCFDVTGKMFSRGSIIRFRRQSGFKRVFVEHPGPTRIACEVHKQGEKYTPTGGAIIYSGEAALEDATSIAADFLNTQPKRHTT